MQEAWVSQRVVTPEGIRPATVVVQDGIIVSVLDQPPAGIRVHDCGNDALLPGLVDAHTHINEPGRTTWEGFETATRAAAAGGFTTLVDMPLNCLPETTTVEALQIKRAAAQGKTYVDWAAWGGAVGTGNGGGNEEHLLPLAAAGVPGYKCFLIYPGCDGFTMIDTAQLEKALPKIAESGLPLLVHAELAGPIDEANARLAHDTSDWTKYATYLASRPDEAELQAIALLLSLCRTYRFRLHIVHLATEQALPMLQEAKEAGLPVTVETCPHYLHLAAESIPDGATQFKCAPPIRTTANREGLWQGLRKGTIDLIATDHSPCPPEMKKMEEGRFDQAWGGIASLSTALSVVWTEAVRRGLSLLEIARWMSSGPAMLAGLSHRVGSIEAGKDANFIRFDTDASWIVTEDGLHYRHKISPYMQETLHGVVRTTVLRGTPIYDAGQFIAPVHGREYVLRP